MTVSLKHAFQSAKPDGADTSIVRPSDWNAEHVLTQATNKLLGRTSAGTGATEEITAGSGLTLGSGTLSADVTSVAGRTGAVTLGISDVASLQTSLDAKAPLASPTFTGTVTLPSGTSIGSVTSTELGYLSGVTSSIQTQINAKLSTSATTYVQQSGPTGSAYLPAGTTAQRPGTPAAGYIRYNSTTGKFEGYGSAWGNIGGGAAIGDTPPSNPGAGDLWWESDLGRLFVYYTDANSSQWVDTSAGGAGQYLPLTGGTVTGTINLSGSLVATDGTSTTRVLNSGGAGIIGTQSNHPLVVQTNNAERMRIDSVGNVGIGTTSLVSAAGYGWLTLNGATGSAISLLTNNAESFRFQTDAIANRVNGIANVPLIFNTNNTERMRIDSSGNVGIGTTNPFYKLDVNGKIRAVGQLSGGYDTAAIEVTGAATGNVGIALHCPGSSAPILRNERGAGDQIDCVNSGQSAFAPFRASAFTVMSDYRIKENLAPISNATGRLKQLNPLRFNFTEGSMMWAEGRTVDGFIAHEVADVVPEAVTGQKDAVKEDGSPLYQGLDQAKLVPLLTAALQEAISRIENLEQELAQLKGGE